MYEAEQKESFIEEYLRSKVVASTSLYAIFKKTYPFEIELKKDVSDFTKEEVLDLLRSFQSKSVNSLLNYCVILKHYSRWVAGKIGENAYEDISKVDVIDLINKDELLTREDIDDIENQLFNWFDKAIVELLWEGVAGPSMRDICTLAKTHINSKDQIIEINENRYSLTERLREILPKAFEENEIMSYGNTMRIIQVKGKGCLYKERPNSRGVDTDDARFRYIYRRIQIFRDYLDMPGLTMKNIQASGLWHYLQLGMKETNLGLRDFLKTKEGERLAKKYGFGDYWVENICQKYEQYI